MSTFLNYEQCPRCAERGKDTRHDNLGVYSDGSKHCYSCGYHVFSKGLWSHKLKEVINDEEKARLPDDFTREIPASAWKWLLDYGLPMSYWKAQGCGYSPATGRLVFRVGTPLQFSIGRLIEPPGAAESHRFRRKWYVWGESHRHCEIINPKENTKTTETIILVEDIVSAHKVGQVATCIPIFGTVIHPCHIYALRQLDRPVLLWLDKDQEDTVHKAAIRLQSVLGAPVGVTITEKDPKGYTLEQLADILA